MATSKKCYVVIELKNDLSRQFDARIVGVYLNKKDAEEVATCDPAVWRNVVERELE